MKFKILLIVTWLCCAVLNTFADPGYVLFVGGPGYVVDEFTTPGVAVRANTDIEVAFLWNTNNAPDTLPSVGTAGNFSHVQSPSSQETATNGVLLAIGGLFGLNDLLANGWNWASNGTSFVSVQDVNPGNFGYNTSTPFQLNGTTGGAAYEFIAVAWNASAGSTAILTGDVAAFGWSNPFSYLTGQNLTDPFSFVNFPQSGMNQFGVASVLPEPTTFALAAFGGALLAFRRRK